MLFLNLPNLMWRLSKTVIDVIFRLTCRNVVDHGRNGKKRERETIHANKRHLKQRGFFVKNNNIMIIDVAINNYWGAMFWTSLKRLTWKDDLILANMQPADRESCAYFHAWLELLTDALRAKQPSVYYLRVRVCVGNREIGRVLQAFLPPPSHGESRG